MQYFVEAGAIGVRRVRKDDLRHIAKASGATLVSRREGLGILYSTHQTLVDQYS